ncbi:MAG: hypothetical protein ABUK01_13745 [Leptospirales bacterium]
MRYIFRTLVFASISGVLGAVILGAIFGDEDNKAIWHALIFFMPTLILHSKLKLLRLPKIIKISFIIIFLLCIIALWIYAGYGIILNKDLIYGGTYDGMAAMAPYIGLGISLILIVLTILINGFSSKREIK